MSNLTGLQNLTRRDQIFKFLINPNELEIDTSKGDILYIEDLSVSFDGFKAIDNLNLYLREGELRCIIGPNGASQLIKWGRNEQFDGFAEFDSSRSNFQILD